MAGKVEHLELNNKVNLKKVNQKWQEKLNICVGVREKKMSG